MLVALAILLTIVVAFVLIMVWADLIEQRRRSRMRRFRQLQWRLHDLRNSRQGDG